MRLPLSQIDNSSELVEAVCGGRVAQALYTVTIAA